MGLESVETIMAKQEFDDFSGMISGVPLRNSWTVPVDRREEKMGDLTFAGNLGKVCETGVLRRWMREIDFGEEGDHLVEAARLALREIKEERKKLRTTTDPKMTAHFASAAVFQMMGKPLDAFSASGPEHNGLRHGLRIVDTAYGLNEENALWSKFHNLPMVGGEISPRIRYLGEAAAILLTELVNPTLNLSPKAVPHDKSNQFIYNKTFSVPDGHSVQFDGLVVPNDLASLNGNLTSNDLFLQKDMGVYSIWEMKCLFRAREGDRDNIAPGTYRWYIKDMHQRLGQLAIWYLEKHGAFNFPDFMTICILRGFAPPVVKHVPFRSKFMSEWANGLKVQQIGRSASGQTRAEILINELERQAQIWRVWETARAMNLEEEILANSMNGNVSRIEMF